MSAPTPTRRAPATGDAVPSVAEPFERGARSSDPLRPTLTWKVCRAIARLFASSFFSLKAYGRHHVPQTGGVLLVANHQSYLDPILLGVHLRRHMSYLAKSELFTNKYFGALIRALYAFPVKQGAGDVGAVKETIRRLREGHMLNIYPEGSRCTDGEIGPVLPGAALVVKKACVPVIPVVIEGSFDAWPKGRRIFRPCPVSVMYGPPLDVRGKKGQEITHLIDRTLRAMFADLRERHRNRLRTRR
jgi:1-acyl-sn-glycerol-3-phosphate acyltransferase